MGTRQSSPSTVGHSPLYGKRGAILGICLIGIPLAVAALAATRSTRDQPDGIVATVGEYAITSTEFSHEYLDFLGRTGQEDLWKHRQTVLNRIINHRLLANHGRKIAIDTTEEFRRHQEIARRKLLIEAHARRNILDSVVVTESDLRDMFVRVNTKLEARHLYARTRSGAEELRRRLDAGESFENLASEVFADTRLSESGGSVGYFSFDEMDAGFENAAFGLETGEVSGPVRTAQGYSIIQLTDRQVEPLLTEDEFARRKNALARYVRYRKEALARRAYIDGLRDRLALEFYDEGLDFLTGMFRLDPTGDFDRPYGRAAEMLVKYNDGEVHQLTVADFLELSALAGDELRARVESPGDLREFAAGVVAREAMVAAAEREGLDKTDVFTTALAREEDRWIYARIHESMVASTDVPRDTVISFYEAHSDDLVQPETIELWEIVVESLLDAGEVEARLGDTPFEQVAAYMSVRPGADRTGGRLGFVRRDQLGVLADTVWATPTGSTIGPVEVFGRYVFFRVGQRTAAHPSPLADVYADIEQELKQLAGRRYIRTVIDSLSTAVGVEIDMDLLRSLDPRAGVSS